jgi:hypothetical protein
MTLLVESSYILNTWESTTDRKYSHSWHFTIWTKLSSFRPRVGAITIGVFLSLRSATEKEEDSNMDVVVMPGIYVDGELSRSRDTIIPSTYKITFSLSSVSC